MKTITPIKASAFDQEIQSDKLVVVDFSATWCGPCRRLEPELDAAAAELGDSVKVIQIDVDESPEISMRYGIQGIPNVMLFKNGSVVDSMLGLQSKAAIVQWIKRHL